MLNAVPYPTQEMNMRRALLALVMTIGLATSAFAADVTGKWVGNVETPNGPIELTYDFKPAGETLTGTVASAMGSLPLGNGKVAGDVITYEVTLEGNVIKHEAKVNEAGTEITVKATGDWGTSEYVVKKVDGAAK
jgi:opacity protein-like surface antigen